MLLLAALCQGLGVYSIKATSSSRRSTVEMAAESLFCLNVQLCIKAEVRDSFLHVIEANRRGTLNEPLAVTYIYGEDESKPNVFHFFEQFKGIEGFEAHKQSAHFAGWEAFVKTDPFTQPPVVSMYLEDSPGLPGLAKVITCYSFLFA